MVCAYVREDNPRALASGLSPIHVHNHTITASMHVHFMHCEISDVKHSNITQICNNIFYCGMGPWHLAQSFSKDVQVINYWEYENITSFIIINEIRYSGRMK